MVDEVTMAILGKLMPTLLFLPIEGMSLQGNTTHQMLVSPLPPAPVEYAPLPDVGPPEQEV